MTNNSALLTNGAELVGFGSWHCIRKVFETANLEAIMTIIFFQLVVADTNGIACVVLLRKANR